MRTISRSGTLMRQRPGQLGSNAKSAAGSMPKATRSGRTRLIACNGHSLHFGLSRRLRRRRPPFQEWPLKHSYALMTRTSAGEL
jgi:hypothetical protein